MNRTLLMLRHAKSSWNHPGLSDQDRPLNPRGLRDAPRIGRLMRDEGILPDVALCSTAERARATLELVLAGAEWSCEVHHSPALYGASPAGILGLVRDLPRDVERALVVGHNPTLEELVRELTGDEVTLPTAALVRMECACEDWNAVARGSGIMLVRLWRPKDLR